MIKTLYLLAKEHGVSIPVLSLTEGKEPSYQDMVDGMPENFIIDASVKLYEEEVDLDMRVK